MSIEVCVIGADPKTIYRLAKTKTTNIARANKAWSSRLRNALFLGVLLAPQQASAVVPSTITHHPSRSSVRAIGVVSEPLTVLGQ